METTGECIYPQEQSVDRETAPVAQDMTVKKKKPTRNNIGGPAMFFGEVIQRRNTNSEGCTL